MKKRISYLIYYGLYEKDICFNIKKTKKLIKKYISEEKYVICEKVFETKNKYKRIKVLRNCIKFPLNKLKIKPFILIDIYGE